MKSKQVFLGIFLLSLMILPSIGAATITQKAPGFGDVSSTTVIPFAISLNTVDGKAYYATISISGQTGLTASANVTSYPTSGTSTINVTVPIGVSVSSKNAGVYQLNVTVTEYNSSSSPQSVLTTFKYTTYVHIISPYSFPEVVQRFITDSGTQSVYLTSPANTSWYIKYKVLYPNITIASKIFSSFQSLSSTPSVNVTVKPSMTTGANNATVSFNLTETNNLKFGEIPVTVIVYQYLNGTNSLYSTYVLHFSFFDIPQGVRAVLSSSFNNITNIGHIKFGNITIQNSNIQSKILGIQTSNRSISILFNDSFTGMVSFLSNVTPSEVFADGQKLTEVFYTIPENMPLGTWDDIGGKVYVYADPSNITAIYSSNTTTTTSSSPSNTNIVSSYSSEADNFYHEHRDLVIITLVFLFIVIIAIFFMKR